MMRDFPMRISMVNLSDLYLTRTEHERAMRRVYKKISGCKGSIFVLCLGLGMLAGYAYDQKLRIDALEKRIREKDETAG